MEWRTALSNLERDEAIEQEQDGLTGNEAYHLIQCPGCGEWIDMCQHDMATRHAADLPHGPGIRQR